MELACHGPPAAPTPGQPRGAGGIHRAAGGTGGTSRPCASSASFAEQSFHSTSLCDGLAPYPGFDTTALEAAARLREASAMRLELLRLLGEDGQIPILRLRCAATGLRTRNTPRQRKARAGAGQLRIHPSPSRQGSKGAGPPTALGRLSAAAPTAGHGPRALPSAPLVACLAGQPIPPRQGPLGLPPAAGGAARLAQEQPETRPDTPVLTPGPGVVSKCLQCSAHFVHRCALLQPTASTKTQNCSDPANVKTSTASRSPVWGESPYLPVGGLLRAATCTLLSYP